MSFVHLHNHTSHSILDGLQKLPEMVAAAVADNNPAIAITDHGTHSGHFSFYTECRKQGIKPILGIEAYITPSRFERTTEEAAKRYEHLTMMAATPKGWANLIEMGNVSHGASFRYKPRMSFDMFEDFARQGKTSGIIVGTGCLGGPVAGPLSRGDSDSAEQAIRTLVESFGQSGVFVEVMDHGIAEQRLIIPELVRLSKKFGLKLVATNDAHYTHAEDAYAHDVWLCVSQKRGGKTITIDDPNRLKFDGSGYHLKTAREMHEVFDNQPGTELAVQNALAIAEMVDDDVIGETRTRLPHFEASEGSYTLGRHEVHLALPDPSPSTLLRQLLREGAALRYGANWQKERPDVVRRLIREFEVIEHFGYQDYFLIVFDAIAWARSTRDIHGTPGKKKPIIVGPGRGSAAGSLAAYCLWITNVEPLSNNLLFERFLDPSRLDFPDIDTDFDANRREEVISYLCEKYGEDRVARLGTFSVAWAKRATKDAGRVTGQTPLAIEVSKNIQVKGVAEASSFTNLLSPGNVLGEPLRQMVKDRPDAKELVDLARKMEGIIAGESIHACGIVVGDEPLDSLIPLRRDRSPGGSGGFVTEWDADDISKFGLIKLDFLSIKDLAVVARVLQLIEELTGEVIDVDNLPMGDGSYANEDPRLSEEEVARDNERVARTWEALAQGKTAGVFQLAAGGITSLTRNVRPESLHDLAAIVALYRPGPMSSGEHEKFARRKRGGEEVSYTQWTSEPQEQEVLRRVLDKSLACLMFQEDLMILAKDIADFDDSEVNRLRKAFSKKIRSEMDALYSRFISGGIATKRSDGSDKVAFREETLDNLWVTFQGSAEYLFNASHAYAYAYIAYITAFLKANWTPHFGAAMLAESDNENKRASMLAALTSEGVSVLPPSVNKGGAATTVDEDGNVRMGMTTVAGAGANTQWIEQERKARGAFTSLHNIMSRVKLPPTEQGRARKLPSQTVDALIDAGALDDFGPRLGLRMVLKAASEFDTPIPDIEYGALERSTREIQRLGVLLSPSPLVELRSQLATWHEPATRSASPVAITSIPHKEGVYLLTIGQVTLLQERTINSGKMCEFVLSGSAGHISCVMWPRALHTWGLPVLGDIIGVTARTRFSRNVSEEETAEGILSLDVSSVWKGELDAPAVDNITPTNTVTVHVPEQPVHVGPPQKVDFPLKQGGVVLSDGMSLVMNLTQVLLESFPEMRNHVPAIEEWLCVDDQEPFPTTFISTNGAREITLVKTKKFHRAIVEEIINSVRPL